MDNILKLAEEYIAAAYGSTSNPSYSFVARISEGQPYKEIITRFRTYFRIKDITDTNYDVSFSYIIEGQYEYLLQISMIAKFYVLFKLVTSKKIMQYVAEASNSDEERILLFLEQNGLTKIDQVTSESITDLIDMESGCKLTVYQALFTNS